MIISGGSGHFLAKTSNDCFERVMLSIESVRMHFIDMAYGFYTKQAKYPLEAEKSNPIISCN
ncbi:MAG: hypothetical protein ACI808_002076 [Paraglaciecola sp.]|jgi:hypothetical protein